MASPYHGLKPLARELVLNDRRVLRTLRDAGKLFTSGRFDSVIESPPLEHAIDLLIKAAKTGDDADVKAATDQVATVLRIWRMMT